eukprot:1628764-Amphidinium_carterae.2
MTADEHGGSFRHTANQQELHFKMNRGIYEMSTWIDNDNGRGITLDTASADGPEGDHSASAEGGDYPAGAGDMRYPASAGDSR